MSVHEPAAFKCSLVFCLSEFSFHYYNVDEKNFFSRFMIYSLIKLQFLHQPPIFFSLGFLIREKINYDLQIHLEGLLFLFFSKVNRIWCRKLILCHFGNKFLRLPHRHCILKKWTFGIFSDIFCLIPFNIFFKNDCKNTICI